MALNIRNFKLYVNSASSIMCPRTGYALTILVEGSDIGSSYFTRLPLTLIPKFAYTTKVQKVFNKTLVTDIKKIKNDYAGAQIQYKPDKLNGKTFVYDITPYLAYLKNKLSVLRYIDVSYTFMNGVLDKLKTSGNENILLYIVDPGMVPEGINLKNLYLYNLLFKLRKKMIDFPYDKVFLYMVELHQVRVIFDRNMGIKNSYAIAAKFIARALQSKKIKIDNDDAMIADDFDIDDTKISHGSVNSSIKVPVAVATHEEDKEKHYSTVKQPSIAYDPDKPKIVKKVAIVKDDDNVEVVNAVLPVAKKDPIAKANKIKKISKSEVDSAIGDIVRNARSFMNSFNIPMRALTDRLKALVVANPDVAVSAVDSYEKQDLSKQVALAKSAVTNTKDVKPDKENKAVPVPSENVAEQEKVSHELGYDKREFIDDVYDTGLFNKINRNNLGSAMARRHNYQTRITDDIKKACAMQLNEVGYRVARVWFSDAEDRSKTEVYRSDFDMVNIKCLDQAGKSVTLKFRVPSIHEDRYVVSGGLRWFLPTIMATLPIFIVKAKKSQIRTNYSSIAFEYGIFNKQEDVRCFIGGYKIPLTLLMSFLLGIDGTLKHYDVEYMVSQKKPYDSSKVSFPLASGEYLVVNLNNLNTAKKCIISGLRTMFRKYRVRDIKSSQEMFSCLRLLTGQPKSEYIIRQTIKFIIDVQTYNVLKSNNLPTELKDIVPYCADLAMSGKTSDKLSIENVYLRTTDIITSAVEKGVAQGIANFKRQHMYDPSKEIKVDQSFVTKHFRDVGALQQLEAQNPVEEVSNYAAVRIVGPGGLPNIDAIMPKDRAVRDSHFGNLDPADTSEGDPGTRIFMSLGHMYDSNKHGFMAMQPNPNNKDILGPAASTMPYADADDQARAVMACSQARQAVPIETAELPIVMTGAEATIPALASSSFTQKANEDSKVQYVDDKVIILKGKDGKTQAVDIRPRRLLSGSGKNAALEPTTDLKVGDSVKKFQVVAKNQFVKPYLTQGINVACAYTTYMGYNYEDGFVVSQSFANKLISLHHDSIEITLKPNDHVEIFPKIGTKYNAGDILLRVKKSIVGDMALSDDFQVIAPENCKVTDIKFYPNGDVKQVIGMIKDVHDYYAKTNAALRASGSKSFFNAREIVDNNGKYTDHSNPIDGNMIVIEVVSYVPARLGDKLANRHGGKGVIVKILPDNLMPITESGVKLDLIYPNLCVVGRMNVGQLHELASAKLMVEATKKLRILVDKKTSRDGLEKFIIGLYSGLDNTSSKEYSTKISKTIKTMNSQEFAKFVQHLCKDGLRLLAAPFQGDTLEQLDATAKKYGVKFKEKLYLPELGKDVMTAHPVAVGYQYMQKLEQISKLKAHARNIGKNIKTTLEPARGKAVHGGLRFGEMDSWGIVNYDRGKELLDELFAVSADNPTIKKEVISDIIQNGKADIKSEIKLSGAGEYFNAIVTGMGINISGN